MDINQNLGNLMKEAQKMQERMQKAQEELSRLIVEAEVGGGAIKMKMNGRHLPVECKIKPSLMEEDVEMMEDLIKAVIIACVQKVEEESKIKIGELTAGLNIPTDFLKKEKDEKE